MRPPAPSPATPAAVEKVAFTCGQERTLAYEVQRTQDGDGHITERFLLDGDEVPSPYVPRGAPACPQCGRHWLGRLTNRTPRPVESRRLHPV